MRFEGAVTIRAPRDTVWRFLTDLDAVGRCAPGVESIEIVTPLERFRAVASVGFGAIRTTFAADASWMDLEPPARARMKVHATAPGSAVDAISEMRLSEAASGSTELQWSADVNVMGTIASTATRLLPGVSRRLADEFFDAVRKKIEGPAPAAFRFGPVPIEDAFGKILGHNLAGPDGRRAFRKGRPISADDVTALRRMGRMMVYVAVPGPDDVPEDRAAERIARATSGVGLRLTPPASARVNVVSEVLGVLRVDAARLARVNGCPGVSLATLSPHAVVRPGQLAATVKVIPYALPSETIAEVEAIASEGGALLRVDPLPAARVGLILSGSPSARDRVVADFEAPLRDRVEALGSRLDPASFVPLEDETGEAGLAAALRGQVESGVALIVLAGETAIVDRHDIAPRAIGSAGGEVVVFGAPVDPGNLLLLAYLDGIPVLGTPGCARSRKTNVIDWVLPRLLAGERLTRAEVVVMGAGGLLEDVPERPMPRIPRGPETQD